MEKSWDGEMAKAWDGEVGKLWDDGMGKSWDDELSWGNYEMGSNVYNCHYDLLESMFIPHRGPL